MQRRRFVVLSASVLAGPALASRGWAQANYPDKPITMVVPAPPGGGTDLVARLYSDLLGQELGQQVIVDNKGGGNGNVGTAIVARAKPDGYTVLMQYSAYHAANPALIKSLNWSPDDFAGVAMGAMAPHVLVIAKKVPADDLKGFIAYARANKGKLNYGSVGQGSVPHLGGVLFNKAAGTDLLHVPYKGAGPATADLVAGQVEMLIVTPPSVSAHIRSGAVKALALASETRHPAFPDIPTTAEAGLPGVESPTWYGIVVPARTPKPIVERLNRELVSILSSPELKKQLLLLGAETRPGAPGEFAAFFKSEVARWAKVIKTAGVKAE